MDKKKAMAKEAKNKSKEIEYNYNKRRELTPDDQIRILHEAYQFLLKKYNLGQELVPDTPLVSPFMKLVLDETVKEVLVQDENNNKGKLLNRC